MVDYVTLYVKVSGTPSVSDEEVFGVYAVAVDDELSEEDQVSVALDSFQENVDIDDIEGLLIAVSYEDGIELDQVAGEPSDLGSRGTFVGKLSDLEIPEALRDDEDEIDDEE
jgi:hypothetical protein